MENLAEKLAEVWRSRLETECPNQNNITRESIIQWLLGAEQDSFAALTPQQWSIAQQAMNYRYRILKERYLGVPPARCYQNLTGRLGYVVIIRHNISTWVGV